MHQETLGELIKRQRNLAKLSQHELALSVGVSQQALGKWENDESLPRPKPLSRLADCLGVPPEEVYRAKLATLSGAMPKGGALTVGRRLPATQPPGESQSSTCFAGLGLLGRLAQALENKQLNGDQIAVLGSVLDSFVRAPLGAATSKAKPARSASRGL